MKTMQYFKYLALGVAALFVAASCQKVDTSGAEKATHVCLYPVLEQLAAEGTGEENLISVVTVLQGVTPSNLGWEVSCDADYVTVKKTEVYSQHKETWSGATHDIIEPGIELSVAANAGFARSFNLVFNVANGDVVTIPVEQLGSLADAEVSTSVEQIEFVAMGGTVNVNYTTNMDEAAFSFTYPEGSAEWLSAKAVEPGVVAVTAQAWNDTVNGREATMTITVGSAETSLASLTIPVVQLPLQEQSFIYGTSVDKLPIERSLQMNKVTDGVFSITTFFTEGNQILLNRNSRTLTYPFYALENGGKLAVIESGDASAVNGPQVTANGLMSLTINYKDLTWEWSRITNEYAMPDEMLSQYKTKAYIARDGSMKTWMVEHMRWDGGNIHPKLGSGMVKCHHGPKDYCSPQCTVGTGGYGTSAFPTTWDDPNMNPGLETSESGNGTLETYSEDGRIYTYQEILGYEARFGIGYARYEEGPWKVGEKYTDARGITYTIKEAPVAAQVNQYTGNNEQDEAAYPMLKVQAQGICPYGWHVANAADWLDLFYAMAQASKSGTHAYPVDESKCTYKQMVDGGVPNIACWLRNTKDWGTMKLYVDEGADEFGFNYFPLGWRYMTQGFMWWTVRMQSWVPLPMAGSKPADYPNAGGARINVIISGDHSKATTTALANMDIGQGILGFRCVKNY